MRRRFNRRLLAASVCALVLFLGPAPDDLSWQDGLSAVPQAHAADGGRGGHGGGGPPAGAGGGHDSGDSHDHDTDSHDHDTDSHDTDSHDHDTDSGHEPGGGKGKGQGGAAYRGGRTGTGKGRGGPSHAVVEKIFESE
jgi:hypothetical protein